MCVCMITHRSYKLKVLLLEIINSTQVLTCRRIMSPVFWRMVPHERKGWHKGVPFSVTNFTSQSIKEQPKTTLLCRVVHIALGDVLGLWRWKEVLFIMDKFVIFGSSWRSLFKAKLFQETWDILHPSARWFLMYTRCPERPGVRTVDWEGYLFTVIPWRFLFRADRKTRWIWERASIS